MSKRPLRVLLGVLIIGVFSLAAWWGGTEAGRLLNQPQHEELLSRREELTTSILRKMESIEVGDTLSDYEFFQNLESELVMLSHAVAGPTWLVFMLPDCHECLQELDELRPILSDRQKGAKVILISNGNPLDLMDMRKEFDLKVRILHDRNGTYIDGIKVFTFPFNILVDQDLVIKKIVVGHLEAEDIK